MNKIYPKAVQDFKAQYRKLVQELVEIRKQSKTSQDEMSEWLSIDRKRIIRFETLKKVDIELCLLYSDKLSVEINLTYKVW